MPEVGPVPYGAAIDVHDVRQTVAGQIGDLQPTRAIEKRVGGAGRRGLFDGVPPSGGAGELVPAQAAVAGQHHVIAAIAVKVDLVVVGMLASRNWCVVKRCARRPGAVDDAPSVGEGAGRVDDVGSAVAEGLPTAAAAV